MIGAGFDRLLWRTPSNIPAHEQTQTIDTAASALRIRDTGGSAPTLVFLCDPPVMVEAYDEVIAAFQSQFRIVIIELPGFGFSSAKHASALMFEQAVQATESALAKLNLEACVVFGPCVCGFVATELAARGKLPVKGLVLMQTPDREGMLSWVERMDPKGMLRIPILGQLMVRFTARRIAGFWLKYATAKEFDAGPMQEVTDAALAKGGGYPLATMLQYWSKGVRDAGLDVPALVVWGTQDRSHKGTCTQSTCKHVPGAEVIEFPNCGHFTELEQPGEFARRVQPFLSSILSTNI